MKTKHTPGEWIVILHNTDMDNNPRPETIRVKEWCKNNLMGDYRGCIICSFDRSHGERPHAYKEVLANAKLMAAAPEMLKELIGLNKKPLHPNHPNSKFISKSEYDKAYKKWKRVNDIIKKATE